MVHFDDDDAQDLRDIRSRLEREEDKVIRLEDDLYYLKDELHEQIQQIHSLHEFMVQLFEASSEALLVGITSPDPSIRKLAEKANANRKVHQEATEGHPERPSE